MINDSRKTLIDCHARLRQFCQSQLSILFSAASEYLFQQAEQADDNETQQRYFEVQQVINTQQNKLSAQFERTLSTLFAVLITPSAQSKARSDTNHHGNVLSLLDNDEMELKVALSSMSHRAEADYAEALFALGQRLALLNNGIKLMPENNPFTPHVLCNNFMDCIDDLSLELQSRLILLKLFDRYFIKHLANIYAEVNLFLVNKNILPNLRYHHRTDRAIAPQRRKSDNAFIKESEDRQSELFEVMRSILSAQPIQHNNQRPSISVERLIAELSALQSQQLMRFTDASIIAEPAPALANTNTNTIQQQAIECVGILFEHILNDDGLHDSVKSLLSHLHTPLLKLALLDDTFLSNPKHDARKLLNQLVNTGEYWLTDNVSAQNNIYQQMQHAVKKIITDFDNDNSSEIFNHVAIELNTYIEKIERQASITERRSIQAIKGKEALASGRQKVSTLINEKICDEPLPKPILQLINKPWSAFLAYTLLRHGDESTQWQEAINFIDELLWYIEPKINNEEILQAKNLRSALNEKLKHGLSSVGLDANEIQQYLNSLDMCSKLATENIHGETNTHDEKINDTYENALANNEHSTYKKRPPNVKESHLQRQKKPTLKASHKINADEEKNSSTKTKPLTATHELASDDSIAAVLSMDFGTWLNWQQKNSPSRRLKLTWYNQKTQNCMLSNSMGQQVAIVNANEIALGISDGSITFNDTHLKKPFFERMLETVVDRLRLKTQTA